MVEFENFVAKNIQALAKDDGLRQKSLSWVIDAAKQNYPYNFAWLGRPAIQYPADLYAMQEIIWQQKPDVIIEAGIAHGGSIIFSASMLAMLELNEAFQSGNLFNPLQPKRKVIAIDIDIRKHNREAIAEHFLAPFITLIEGSSIDESIISEVQGHVGKYHNVTVFLDSNHTHEHVLAELNAYAHLVPKGGYCCVFDTIIDDMPDHMFDDRSWGAGDNPKTAVHEFLKSNNLFEIDKAFEAKIQTTVAPDGFLKRVR